MGAIFINYRREETAGEARALFDELSRVLGLGAVFMDVEGIGPGLDFREVLRSKLANIDMMLTLVGSDWLDLRDGDGRRRLDDAEDFVRAEIRAALERKIPVTPVLLQGAVMPRERDLPEDIRSLAFRNGFEIRHTRWSSDVRDLIQGLGLVKQVPPATEPAPTQAPAPTPFVPAALSAGNRRLWIIGAGAATVGMVAAGAGWYRSRPAPQQQAPAAARDPKANWTLVITAPEPQSLHFRVWSTAETEQWTLPIHSKQVDKIVRDGWITASGSQPYGTGRALGTLLLPAALRSQLEQAAEDASVRLAVDPTTARLPWEVVIGNASDRVRPLRVTRTVVGATVPSVRSRAARRALVIAAPEVDDPRFPKLPGAVAEGKAVHQILVDRSFEVRLNSEESAANVLRDFSGADYRVMLVSAHGESNAKLPSGEIAAGIVLGDGAFLTANDFDQLRVAPYFVFFNAANLGEVPSSADPASQLRGFIPARLLQKGVRTILVPGMQLDDQEAFLFAKDLFTGLVDGTKTVGDAMQVARLASLKRQPSQDWWGGYHLYGETDYRVGDA